MTIGDCQPDSVFPEVTLSRPRVLCRRYYPEGAISIVDAKALIAARTCYDSYPVPYPMSCKVAIDIDHWHSLQMAKPMASIVE